MVAAALSALITTAALLAVPPCRRCLTPVSRVALALLLTIALAEIPAAVDAALTVVVVLTTGAINRAREARHVMEERWAERNGILNEITDAVGTSSAPQPRVQYLSAQD
jgi:uncharacterized membrane protein